MPRRFDIRAEMPGSRYEDFHVGAEDLPEARKRVESRIRENRENQHVVIEWRGLVAFVNRAP